MAYQNTSKAKKQEEKYVQLIRDLSALPQNKQCFDCHQKGPTYVNMTIGSFICTACSGLLRGLNPPHRVKSINMSTFTQDEVEFIRNHGNSLNKMVYLGLYDSNTGFSPDPKDTERFKEFLSQKYERKRWFVSPTEAVKQKVKAETDALLEKANNNNTKTPTGSTTVTLSQTNNTPNSNHTHSEIHPPPPLQQPSRTSISANNTQPPMLFFDAPVTTSSTTVDSTTSDVLLDVFSSPASISPTTTNFFNNQTFSSFTTQPQNNGSNWSAFAENTNVKSSDKVLTQPPSEQIDKYAALSELFTPQNTVNDHYTQNSYSAFGARGQRTSIPNISSYATGTSILPTSNSMFASSPSYTNFHMSQPTSVTSNIQMPVSSSYMSNVQGQTANSPFNTNLNYFSYPPHPATTSFANNQSFNPNPFQNQMMMPSQQSSTGLPFMAPPSNQESFRKNSNSRGGGISFDDHSITAEDITEHTPLIDNVEQIHPKIRTTGIIIFHIFLTILFEAAIIVLPLLCHPNKQCVLHGYVYSLYIHSASWLFNVAFDRFYHYQQDKSRRNGYLEFYRKTHNLRRAPLFIISAGNAILVSLIKVLEYCYDKPCTSLKLRAWHFLQFLTTIEVILMMIALVWYLVLTIKFNSRRARPDAAQEDSSGSFAATQTSISESGSRNEAYTENILEKQADMIRYLRERNIYLGRLVMRYKEDLDSTPQRSNNNV
ncbi:unnamed protein product [Didymodactylos carnosus]|uniref:Arf-GAP domain-containing protein n=1 Tax=Didymodactylos carnosus TaxID=1234261 RepID=A0A813QUT1_9BILA|nr:unnamed protein product [Didymodactylos carnosus]CAF0773302.1 unnamed protein product [Didymodactylos carnosus]CAF3521090.1 unnamed protein product [Didymodactylos carnosus]CAF3555634.1 unnamed protein product [Didymodactylos carnosus]